MFAVTKGGRDRKKYVRNVRELLRVRLHLTKSDMAKENEIWERWITREKREWSDLRNLLTEDVSDSFKARAITILFAPKLKWSPFMWDTSEHDTDYVSTWFFSEEGALTLSDLSVRLQNYVMVLLQINIDAALAPNASAELRATLLYYNEFILQALETLGENNHEAVKLFSRYQINDPVAFWNMDEASGYNPFQKLLFAPIPERWKDWADSKMREIIRAELEDGVKPRNDWENALRCYVNHIQLGLYKEKFPYSTELFASQIRFVLEQPASGKKPHFHDWDICKILPMLEGEENSELRYSLAKHIMFTDRGKDRAFRVYSKDTMDSARMMIEDCAEISSDLRRSLESAIAEGEAKFQKDADDTRERQYQKDALLSQMQ